MIVLLCSALTVIVAISMTALAAQRTGRWSVIDVTWGLGFVLIALTAALLGTGALSRRALLLALVAIWGLRLAGHIALRARGHGEDPRYQEMKDNGRSLTRNVLAPQGIAMFVVSLPVQVAALSDRPFGILAWLGVAVWATGLGFEAIGDAQLRAFKADRANAGKIMDRGLWAWTRHPNYFGDACVWFGIWLIAADSGWLGAATVISPIAMCWFLVAVTGARLLERTMMQRPGYRDYAQRTSKFFPRPPRRTTNAGSING